MMVGIQLRRRLGTFTTLVVGLCAGCAASIPSVPGPAIAVGNGTFEMPTVKDPGKSIVVHYHRPRSFGRNSPILIVASGAGRNAAEYRDMWQAASDKVGVLVLAPEYPEADYDIAGYQFGGVIKHLVLLNPRIDDKTRTYYLRDEDIRFEFNPERERWLFHDFDRLFALAVAGTDSRRIGYDIFGHSAGGQILHRMALFHPDSQAERLVAANAGFYTMPRADLPLPFGLEGTGLGDENLRRAFGVKLVLFLGVLDNEHETRGIHLRMPSVDAWGIGRFERGRRFFDEGRRVAASLGAGFHWVKHEVPDVGHDPAAMAKAAARYLYGIQ